MIIYLNGETGDLCRLARNKRTHVVRRVTNPTPLPAGTPTSFSDEELMQMDADDVDRMLPKHNHQTYGHPMRQACEQGDGEELQDVVNRGVFGSPKPYDKGDIVIGLMWVYAIKRTRGKITLMGNQERLQSLIGREDAYAPVAQMITTRLLIAMHLGIPGIYFRKMDIKNAYINENMRRDVRCKLPPGYTIQYLADGSWIFRKLRKGEIAPKVSLQVVKALYGGMECGRTFGKPGWIGT